MNILIACEFSGVVRSTFAEKGHYVFSCDYLETEIPPGPRQRHFVGNVLKLIYDQNFHWDMMIAFPPCTFLATCGSIWWKKQPWRLKEQKKALDFVGHLMDAPIEKIAIENPVGVISTKIRKADQYIQPCDFGHDYTKKTGLWLKGLPLLKATKKVVPKKTNWKNTAGFSSQKDRELKRESWRRRVRLPKGVAKAMAEQWG